MKQLKAIFIIVLGIGIFYANPVGAQYEKEKKVLYDQLKQEGWHKNEVHQILYNYIPSKSPGTDTLNLPLPEQHKKTSILQQWVEEYKSNYKVFEGKFAESPNSSKIVKAPKIVPNGKIKREHGKWKHVAMYATAGRIYDLEIHPEKPGTIYANPDGDGIFKTINGGKNWESITDNIPDRLHRDSYENIIVDPKNFNHVFSISRLGNLYETKDGGNSWAHIKNKNLEDARAPQFKWVEALRNGKNELVLIGTVTKNSGLNYGWEPGVYRSIDSGKSWQHIKVDGGRLQEMAFHQTEKDVIYLAGASKLYKSVNAGGTFEILHDFALGDRPMFVTTASKKFPNALYAVISEGDHTKLYFSPDNGNSWELRQDSKNNIAYNKGIFGGYGSSGWTSYFAVDPFDINHLVAANVGSCESFDGGKTWVGHPWYKRALAKMPNGEKALSPFGGHNADNHVVKFHPEKEGFVVKGCDAGIMYWEKADTNWVNINGNMPAFLWYSVVVNEFGDRYIAGNTQDVNIQTYRYNQWENDRGYEGDAIFMNPSTNTSYFPVAKTEEGEGLNFLEPGFWKMHSWNHPKVAPNYKNLDQLYIAYGRRPAEPEPQLPKYLYVTKNRGISFERVPNLDSTEVFSVNVSRTEIPVLTVFTTSAVMTSKDEGSTWESSAYPDGVTGEHRTRKVSGCVDPNNPQRLWVGGANGKVFSSVDGGKSWNPQKGSLPDGLVLELLHHEGTDSDLYALVKGYGVFYKESKSDDWRLWMDGFNLADFSEIRIDYPSQKLLASSYGRGLWEADLEKTADRFFKKAPAIIYGGKIKGKNVFRIDTDLQIPAYYNYTWTLNGKNVGTNSRVLLLNKVKKGDEVKLVLSPIYSSDLQLEISYAFNNTTPSEIKPGKGSPAFFKDHFLDVGHLDLFGAKENFSFCTLIKPITEGVIATNRRTFYRDAKGWYLEVTEDGKLHFNAAFYQNRSLEKTFEKGVDQSVSVTSNKGLIQFNQWVHVAVTVNRLGGISLYANGKKVANQKLGEIPVGLPLNNVFNFTLLGDPYGKRKMICELKDVAIHTKELSQEEIQTMVKKGNERGDNLASYIDFTQKGTEKTTELFSGNKAYLKGREYLK